MRDFKVGDKVRFGVDTSGFPVWDKTAMIDISPANRYVEAEVVVDDVIGFVGMFETVHNEGFGATTWYWRQPSWYQREGGGFPRTSTSYPRLVVAIAEPTIIHTASVKGQYVSDTLLTKMKADGRAWVQRNFREWPYGKVLGWRCTQTHTECLLEFYWADEDTGVPS